MEAKIYIETDDGSELEVEIEFTYSYTPAYISGLPEDCYPEESDFEWEHNETHEGYNALEWWEIQSISEDRIFDECMKVVDQNDGCESLLKAMDGYDKLVEENEDLSADRDMLREAAQPFANFACSPKGECGCNNCKLRDAIQGSSSQPPHQPDKQESE